MEDGLTTETKVKIKVDDLHAGFTQSGKQKERDRSSQSTNLRPATGTGTFLAETIRQIYKKFEGQREYGVIMLKTICYPRLNGFELLMASYAMAHLKLDLLLSETGYKPTTNQRFKVFLTTSLEEYHPDTGHFVCP